MKVYVGSGSTAPLIFTLAQDAPDVLPKEQHPLMRWPSGPQSYSGRFREEDKSVPARYQTTVP